MSADDTYAPKSPDFSSFYSAGPTEPAPQHLHHPQAAGSHPGLEYKADPTAYNYLSSYIPPSVQLNNHALGQPHYQPQPQHPPPPQQQTIKSEYQPYSPRLQQQRLSSGHSQGLPHSHAYGAQPPTSHPQQHAQPPFGSPYGDQILHPGAAQHQAQFFAPPPGSGALAHPPNATVTPHSNMPPRKAAPPPAPIIEPSPVKTKFPTARIKRIMQADEEVGKVAQQTPIAVGKALELFMIQLVSKSADVAKEKGSKRVTAPMLKHVVETDEQWDFLRDIVSRVENEKEGSKAKAKAESSSDEEIAEPKKRTRGGRKKKV